MEMSGERLIAAPRGVVWKALNDPEVLKACIPGCEEIEQTSPTELTAKVTQKVGPVKAKFTGQIELSDIVPEESYRISGTGKGGAAGGASGGAAVSLTETDDGTMLTYQAEAKVTGKIAQLGARLIDGFAKKMADQFFSRFQEVVEGPKEDAEAAEGDGADGDAPADEKKGLWARLTGA
ncbi:MAG: carbon monoxide dehydrogenase subunit G [Pseudomonadota bacterium]